MDPIKISQLPSGTDLTGAEVIPIVQNGVTIKVLLSDLALFIKNYSPSTSDILTDGNGNVLTDGNGNVLTN